MGEITEKTSIIIGFDKDFIKRFRKTGLWVGIALTIIGLVGVVMPQVMSLVSELFLGWLMFAAGVLAAYMVFLSKGRAAIAWLKPFLLIVTGGILLLYPLAGIATLALLLSFYLLLDALASFGLAHDYYPLGGWGWMVFNGFLSLVLAAMIFAGWPATSAIWVGIFIGISLLVDGLVLIAMSLAAGKVAGQ